MNIEKLFILRHADYEGKGANPSLSETGKRQAKRLGQLISKNIGNRKAVMWTSPAARAMETSHIILQELCHLPDNILPVEKLWSDDKHDEDFLWLLRQLELTKTEILIITTHYEYVREFPELLGFDQNESTYAHGILIENGICTLFG